MSRDDFPHGECCAEEGTWRFVWLPKNQEREERETRTSEREKQGQVKREKQGGVEKIEANLLGRRERSEGKRREGGGESPEGGERCERAPPECDDVLEDLDSLLIPPRKARRHGAKRLPEMVPFGCGGGHRRALGLNLQACCPAHARSGVCSHRSSLHSSLLLLLASCLCVCPCMRVFVFSAGVTAPNPCSAFLLPVWIRSSCDPFARISVLSPRVAPGSQSDHTTSILDFDQAW